jgi:AcrR family transcriptional regulator
MANDVREMVIAEARRLFFQYGFRKVSMDEIASTLRMSKKTLYALFRAKDDLIRTVVGTILEPNLGRITSLIQNEKTVSGFFSGSIAVFHEIAQAISEPMISDMRTMPDIWREVETRRQKVLLGLRKVLERGKRNGEIRPDLHIDLFLKIFILMVNAVGNPAVMMELNMKPSELADQIQGVFFKGIVNHGPRKRGEA